MGADIAEHFNVIQVQKPVRVVDHDRLIGVFVGFRFLKVDKPPHLFNKAVNIVLDRLFRHHLPHIRAPRGVADHAGSAA